MYLAIALKEFLTLSASVFEEVSEKWKTRFAGLFLSKCLF